MSREKQIEATAKSCPYNVNGECVLDETRCTTNCEVAIWGHSLIEGYCKQSEGEWVEKNIFFAIYKCSICGAENLYKDGHACLSKFCPNCGAKMKGENK